MRTAGKLIVVLAAIALGTMSSAALCQTGHPIEDKTVTPAIQAEIIDSLMEAVRDYYVFPDVAKKMEKHVRDQYRKTAYKDVTSTREFARRLTEDMQSISHDLHLHADYMSDEDIALATSDTSGRAADEEGLRQARKGNFGFREIRMLPGNVGYLRFDGFSERNEAGATAMAAMNFLANSDAIIFDMRYNGGGSPKMIQLVSSYLFAEPTHLNSFYIRRSDSIEQYWTQPHVPGPRILGADVYVLTSGRTFSAAEEFTYNLKNLKRGTIVGDTTGGGAHPVEGFFWANLNLSASVPFGRAINPITGTNWEGTGVAPDLAVPSDQALESAHADALKKILTRTTNENDRFLLEWASRTLEDKLHPATVDVTRLVHYAGTYGPRSIKYEDGQLFYRRGDNPWTKLIPMSESLFRMENVDYFRLEVALDAQGQPAKLVGQYDDGTVDESPRTGP
jgi:C-terminal processing protease CtpA/Prc